MTAQIIPFRKPVKSPIRRGPYRKKRRSRRSYEFNRGVGRRLRYARHQLNISEAAVATTLGVSLRTYRGYEDGKVTRNYGWKDYADAFGVSLSWLFGLKGHEAERPRFRLRAV
jgi:DNA-binding XRE family transcriptional regulator